MRIARGVRTCLDRCQPRRGRYGERCHERRRLRRRKTQPRPRLEDAASCDAEIKFLLKGSRDNSHFKPRRRSMSNSLERPADRKEPSPYPPKWVRGLAAAGERPRARWFDGLTDGRADDRPPDEDLVIGRVRVPRSLDPTVRPP